MTTETSTFSLSKGDSLNFEREVSAVTVSTGSIVVTYKAEGGNVVTKTLKEGDDTYEVPNSPTVGLYAPDHTNGAVTFADNAVLPVFQKVTAGETPEVRGDADPSDDDQTGSYESRSKESLFELAQERKLDVNSRSTKAEIIEALRG